MHLVRGQSTGLISANFVSVAHSLGRGQLSDKVLLILHLGDGEGEGNGDGEGKTLRHGNNNDGNRNNEAVGDNLPEVHIEVEFIRLSSLDARLDDDSDKGKDGDGQTELANTFSDAIELLLEGSLVGLNVHGETSLALVSVVTDSKNNARGFSFLDL